MSTTDAHPTQGQSHRRPHPATATATEVVNAPGRGEVEHSRQTSGSRPSPRMSYKFQRLREKLRQAVTSGELSGKLPGERALAKRFHVNAKTLSKALTDLAAEGLLDRNIGRGTYVKGTAPPPAAPPRWLVLADDPGDPAMACLLDQFRNAHGELHVAASASTHDMRPSFLNGIGAVIDLAADTPETFLRDLVVRNLPVVAVNREPRTYSTHAVLLDPVLGAQCVARDLLRAGHRRVAAVEPLGSNSLSQAIRHFAGRYRFNDDITVETLSPSDVAAGASTLAEHGFSALVCDCVRTANVVKASLEAAGVDVPGHLSLMAIGCLWGGKVACPCSGYFVDCEPLADAVVRLLEGGPPSRPTVLWLAGEFVDRGTMRPASAPAGDRPWIPFGDAVA